LPIFVFPLALAAFALAPALHLVFPTFAAFAFFAPVCHQDRARSIWLLGTPVAVCARCLGIYMGAAVGALLTLPRRIALLWLSAALAINALDVGTEIAGLHGNWLDVRLVLGMLLGGAIAALLATGVSLYSYRVAVN
jgi:uncharacterized membrane protein